MQAVIKPPPLQAAVEGRFTLDDFDIDTTTGTATCPGGVPVAITPAGAARFTAHCTGCVLNRGAPPPPGGVITRTPTTTSSPPPGPSPTPRSSPTPTGATGHGRTQHRLDGPRGQPPAPLPRHRTQPALARPPSRCHRPRPAHQSRPHPHPHRLDHRLTGPPAATTAGNCRGSTTTETQPTSRAPAHSAHNKRLDQ